MGAEGFQRLSKVRLPAALWLALALSPLFLPTYWVIILTEILIMALFALGFNLLLGFTGLLSFGQAGFFGTGAYAAALLLEHGPPSLLLALACGGLSAALAALVVGYLCVRRDEIYFAMLTLGFGMMLFTVAHNWREVTGGSDGLPVFSVPPLEVIFWEWSLFSPTVMYLFTLITVTAGTLFLWRVVHSPFGLMLASIRENKERLAFAGGPVRSLRLAAFVIAGLVSGVAGALFCLFNHMATPDIMHWSFSARPVLMTILGGAGVFLGPAFGAALFFILEHFITDVTESWMFFLGCVLVPVVVFFPRGVLGTLLHRLEKGGRA